MFKKWMPNWFSSSIYKIDFQKLKDMGIKYVFSDLDNTIVPHDVYTPSNKEVEFIKNLKDNGFKFLIVSNNKEERVSNFCKEHKIEYLFDNKKPFPKKLNLYIKDKKINKDKIVFIGDQIITDIWVSNNVGIKSILVDPIQKKESKATYLNRKIDMLVRKRLAKKNRLISIERGD